MGCVISIFSYHIYAVTHKQWLVEFVGELLATQFSVLCRLPTWSISQKEAWLNEQMLSVFFHQENHRNSSSSNILNSLKYSIYLHNLLRFPINFNIIFQLQSYMKYMVRPFIDFYFSRCFITHYLVIRRLFCSMTFKLLLFVINFEATSFTWQAMIITACDQAPRSRQLNNECFLPSE